MVSHRFPTGFPQAIMRLRLADKNYKDMPPLLKEQFATELEELRQRKIKVNLSASGLRATMKNHYHNIDAKDPDLLKEYRQKFEKQSSVPAEDKDFNTKYNIFALKLLGDDVPESDWPEQIQKEFPEIASDSHRLTPVNVQRAAKRVPREGHEQLWARRDAAAKRHRTDLDLRQNDMAALKESNERIKAILIQRRIDGVDASKEACLAQYHAERDAEQALQDDSDDDEGTPRKRRRLDAATRERYNATARVTRKRKRASKAHESAPADHNVGSAAEEEAVVDKEQVEQEAVSGEKVATAGELELANEEI